MQTNQFPDRPSTGPRAKLMIEPSRPCSLVFTCKAAEVNLPRFLSRGIIFAAAGLALVACCSVHAAETAPAPNGKSRKAGLDPREPGLSVQFPDAARVRGISQGHADACVLVDGQGRPLDFLVTSETDPAFGRALVDYLRTATFQPALQHGVAVPARCAFPATISPARAGRSPSRCWTPVPAEP